MDKMDKKIKKIIRKTRQKAEREITFALRSILKKQAPKPDGVAAMLESPDLPPERKAVLTIRKTLLTELQETLAATDKKRGKLAKKLGIPSARISEIMNGKIRKFSITRLIYLLSRAGKRVDVQVF